MKEFRLLIQHTPGGGENQAEDAKRLFRQPLQDRQHERRRLSASCLRTAHTVTAWEGHNKRNITRHSVGLGRGSTEARCSSSNIQVFPGVRLTLENGWHAVYLDSSRFVDAHLLALFDQPVWQTQRGKVGHPTDKTSLEAWLWITSISFIRSDFQRPHNDSLH